MQTHTHIPTRIQNQDFCTCVMYIDVYKDTTLVCTHITYVYLPNVHTHTQTHTRTHSESSLFHMSHVPMCTSRVSICVRDVSVYMSHVSIYTSDIAIYMSRVSKYMRDSCIII